MVTYNDVVEAEQGKQLLSDKKAQTEAHSILNSELFNAEQEAEGIEQQGQTDQVQAIAENAIQTMQEMEQQGQDPMQMLQQLPPEVQERIAQLLDQGGQQPQQTQQQQVQPQGGGNPMGELTAMSQQLAGGQ